MQIKNATELLEFGIKLISLDQIQGSLYFEEPVSIQCQIRGTCVLGAFSYTGRGIFKNTQIGRYCSISSVNFLSDYEHPTNRTTTHPLTYNGTRHFDFYPRYELIKNVHATRYVNPNNIGTLYIGNDVWIGTNVRIVKPVEIGNGAIIGSESLVNKNIPNYEMWGGVPCYMQKNRWLDKIKNSLDNFPWWILDLTLLENGLLNNPESYILWAEKIITFQMPQN